MTTYAEMFQVAVGVNLAYTVLEEMKCARKSIANLKNLDNEKASEIADHLDAHINATGRLTHFMVGYYDKIAAAFEEEHPGQLDILQSEFEDSEIVSQMADAFNDSKSDQLINSLKGLVKTLGLNVEEIMMGKSNG